MDVVVFWDFSNVSLCIYNECFVVAMGFFFLIERKSNVVVVFSLWTAKCIPKASPFSIAQLLENMLS